MILIIIMLYIFAGLIGYASGDVVIFMACIIITGLIHVIVVTKNEIARTLSAVTVSLILILMAVFYQNNKVPTVEGDIDIKSYSYGYDWAEETGMENFDDFYSDCSKWFDNAPKAESGCNDYIRDNLHERFERFGYYCTGNCSGHQAGYDWAEEKGIEDADDCGGNSNSFIEGCQTYVEENY